MKRTTAQANQIGFKRTAIVNFIRSDFQIFIYLSMESTVKECFSKEAYQMTEINNVLAAPLTWEAFHDVTHYISTITRISTAITINVFQI